MERNPRKSAEFEINPFEDGFMIYQPERDRVHYLNNTAALILELCTGENSPEQIAVLVQQAFNLQEAPEVEVRRTLNSLQDEGLVR